MRIITAAQFLALPENVVFAMYANGQMGPLCIKGESFPERDQFLYSEISVAMVRSRTDDDPIRGLLYAVDSGETIEMDFETMVLEREVMDKQLFMAWDMKDVAKLISRLTACLFTPEAPRMPFYPAVRLATVGQPELSGSYLYTRQLLEEVCQNEDCIGTACSGMFMDEIGRSLKGPIHHALHSHHVSNLRMQGDHLLCDVQVLNSDAGRRLAACKQVEWRMRSMHNAISGLHLVGVDAYPRNL